MHLAWQKRWILFDSFSNIMHHLNGPQNLKTFSKFPKIKGHHQRDRAWSENIWSQQTYLLSHRLVKNWHRILAVLKALHMPWARSTLLHIRLENHTCEKSIHSPSGIKICTHRWSTGFCRCFGQGQILCTWMWQSDHFCWSQTTFKNTWRQIPRGHSEFLTSKP